MKTIDEWMELIEDPALRELARSRARDAGALSNCEPDEWNAFYGAFDWSKTPEGLRFWSVLFGKYIPDESDASPIHISALNCHSKQQEAERKLAEYSFLGGMVDVGLYDGQLEWEAGRNLGPAYCVDGKGSSLVECAESIADHVMEEMRANRDKA